MLKDYITIEHEASPEFTEKRSRFIGYIKPVTTEAEALDFISSLRSKHWDATHNVYAYVLRDGQIRRYSDDGEPLGTAGIPCLDVLLKEGVTDLCVVATRYFGGIMLGAGGLVRAYSHTAKIAVDAGGIITMSLCKIAKIKSDYTFYGRLQPLICSHGAIILDTEFADDVTITFKIPGEDFEKLNADIFDQSNGRYKADIINEEYSKI